MAQALSDFVDELVSTCLRENGAIDAFHEEIAALLVKPIQAAHDAACGIVGRSMAVDNWLRILAGPDQASASDFARIGARNLAAILRQHLTMAVATPVTPGPIISGQVTTPNGFASPQMPKFNDFRSVLQGLQKFAKFGVLESQTIQFRLSLAQAISTAAFLTPGVRSTKEVGSAVHSELQQRYVGENPSSMVIADRRVYGPGFGDWSTGVPLAEAAASGGGHPALTAMQLAWLSRNWDSRPRADVTNYTTRENWEIKPVLSAPLGVIQEAWYRCSYNWTAAMLAEENPAMAPQLTPLEPGWMWSPSSMRTIIPSGEIGADAWLVIPFCVPALPGLVLYSAISGPTVADAALVLTYLMFHLKKKLNDGIPKPILEGLAAARNLMAEIAGWVFAFVMLALIAVVLIIVAVIVFEALSAAFAALAAASSTAAATLAMLFASMKSSEMAAALILLVLAGVSSKKTEEKPVTMQFGPVSIALPAGKVAQFDQVFSHVMGAAYKAICEVLSAHKSGNS